MFLSANFLKSVCVQNKAPDLYDGTPGAYREDLQGEREGCEREEHHEDRNIRALRTNRNPAEREDFHQEGCGEAGDYCERISY